MNFDYYIITNGQAVPENPYYSPKEMPNLKHTAEAWREFNSWAKSHTLPFIGSLPDGSRVNREETEEIEELFSPIVGWVPKDSVQDISRFIRDKRVVLRLKEQPSPKMVDRDKVIALLEEAKLLADNVISDHYITDCINKIKSL